MLEAFIIGMIAGAIGAVVGFQFGYRCAKNKYKYIENQLLNAALDELTREDSWP